MGTTRDEYVRKLKARLDDWNRELDQLRVKAASAAATAREEYEERISQLQVRCKDLEQKLHTLAGAAESAWEDMSAGLDAAAEALGKAVQAARAHFREKMSAGG